MSNHCLKQQQNNNNKIIKSNKNRTLSQKSHAISNIVNYVGAIPPTSNQCLVTKMQPYRINLIAAQTQ